MAAKFSVRHDDISQVPADLLLLKYAKAFHGADMAIARLLASAAACSEKDIAPLPDDFALVESGKVIAPSRVMFIGTPHLRGFSYMQMRHFASRAIEVVTREALAAKVITTTVHGVNYGLDATEALQNLVRGFQDGLAQYPDCGVEQIVFVEKHERTARILKAAMDGLRVSVQEAQKTSAARYLPNRKESIQAEVRPEGDRPLSRLAGEDGSERKKHVFVAMPFSEDFQDIYEFGIYGPIRRCGYICERVDEGSFTGDILQRITERISTASFVIADLTGARANVYLEVGYAWGRGVPVITLAREGEKLHFDVSTHRCIFYRTIGHLAKELEKLVQGLPRGQVPEGASGIPPSQR